MIQGPGRSDEPCNYLKVCSLCHDSYHRGGQVFNGERWPKLTMGMLLQVKIEEHPSEWDLGRLLSLAGFVGAPDKWTMAYLPERFQAERRRWSRF